MLVLKRRIGEEILVGGNIRVVVIEIDRGCVRLGIEAPEEVSIVRKEIAENFRKNPIQPKV